MRARYLNPASYADEYDYEDDLAAARDEARYEAWMDALETKDLEPDEENDDE